MIVLPKQVMERESPHALVHRDVLSPSLCDPILLLPRRIYFPASVLSSSPPHPNSETVSEEEEFVTLLHTVSLNPVTLCVTSQRVPVSAIMEGRARERREDRGERSSRERSARDRSASPLSPIVEEVRSPFSQSTSSTP